MGDYHQMLLSFRNGSVSWDITAKLLFEEIYIYSLYFLLFDVVLIKERCAI